MVEGEGDVQRLDDLLGRDEAYQLQDNQLTVVVQRLSLKDVGAVYRRLAAERSPVVARRFLLALDYPGLEALARRGVRLEGGRREVLEPRNDPAHVDEHVVLLFGMQNERVRHTQAFLRAQGFDCPDHGLFDDPTFAAHDAYLVEQLGRARLPAAGACHARGALRRRLPAAPDLRALSEGEELYPWWDLVELAGGPEALDPELPPPGADVELPDLGAALEAGRRALRGCAFDAPEYHRGRAGYLPLWEVVAVALLDAAGAPRLPAGSEARLLAQGQVIWGRAPGVGEHRPSAPIDERGRLRVELPRGEYALEVRAPGGPWVRVDDPLGAALRRRQRIQHEGVWPDALRALARRAGPEALLLDGAGELEAADLLLDAPLEGLP